MDTKTALNKTNENKEIKRTKTEETLEAREASRAFFYVIDAIFAFVIATKSDAGN